MVYSPCLDIFFAKLPFEERMRRVADLGFGAFEFWSWWDKDIDAIRSAMLSYSLELAALCTRFVPLTDSARRDEYESALKETIAVAHSLRCHTIISQVGPEISGSSREEQHDSIVRGLRQCAPVLEQENMLLVIEPLNTIYDHKGYFLTQSAEAARIIQSVGSESVAMLFDVYHQQVTEGNLIGNIRSYQDMIGHIHIADCPGRHDIGSGEINYASVLTAIEATGYEGRIGIELFPEDADHSIALRNPLFHRGASKL
ncbi:MAG TPA: TIM barrel protein [Spirochaetia bacterium]|nr:TIM barrel protein [Spirochaetia bacterium]